MPVPFVVILGMIQVHAWLHDIFCIYHVWFNILTSMSMYHIWLQYVGHLNIYEQAYTCICVYIQILVAVNTILH